MKTFRFLLSLIALVTSLFAFTSCKKTYTCCYAGQCGAITQSSYPSRDAFMSAIKTLEDNGYSCK